MNFILSTNESLLIRKKIKESGITHTYLAAFIGMTEAHLKGILYKATMTNAEEWDVIISAIDSGKVQKANQTTQACIPIPYELCKLLKKAPEAILDRVKEEFYVNPLLAREMSEKCQTVAECNELLKSYFKSLRLPSGSSLAYESYEAVK